MGEASCPKATIVVPVYNSARSIQRCVDSLLAQSERSIQVVCVNDGSTDDSLNVLRQIELADDRVLVIDQETRASRALEMPVSMPPRARPSFLWTPTITSMSRRSSACCMPWSLQMPRSPFLAASVNQPMLPPTRPTTHEPQSRYLRARDPQLLFHANAQPYACRAAFSRELLNREGIRFAPGLALGEDVVFQFAAYALARKAVVMPDKFYHYVMESESATHESTVPRLASKSLTPT